MKQLRGFFCGLLIVGLVATAASSAFADALFAYPLKALSNNSSIASNAINGPLPKVALTQTALPQTRVSSPAPLRVCLWASSQEALLQRLVAPLLPLPSAQAEAAS